MIGIARISSLLKRFRKHEKGGAAIEASIGLPLLLFAVVGIFEITLLMFQNVALEHAVLSASRFGVTGSEPDPDARAAKILEVVEKETFGFVDMNNLEMVTLVYDSFADVGQEEPYDDANLNGEYDEGEDYVDVNGNSQWDDDVGVDGLGTNGDIVLYRLNYPATSFFGLFSFADRTINLTAAVAVRNEP